MANPRSQKEWDRRAVEVADKATRTIGMLQDKVQSLRSECAEMHNDLGLKHDELHQERQKAHKLQIELDYWYESSKHWMAETQSLRARIRQCPGFSDFSEREIVRLRNVLEQIAQMSDYDAGNGDPQQAARVALKP